MTEDMTQQFQEWYGDKVEINSAILNTETGVVDIVMTPIKPVEHIDITIKVEPEVWTDRKEEA